MRDGWTTAPAFRGGCQCGAVRYAVAAGPVHASVCHCRMCQRATGNAFAPLMLVDAARVTWAGTPAEWASSDHARRGFCATCGTPLYFRDFEGLQLMAGAMAPPTPFVPVAHDGAESRVDWLSLLPTLPDLPTSPEDPPVRSRQTPESGPETP